MTTLRRTAMPILRYRTRDLTSKMTGECPCGRKHVRLTRFVGRSDDMLIVRGVNVFPSQIEEVIMRHKWLGGNYVIHLTKAAALDQMTVKVEIAKTGFDGSMEALRKLRGDLQRQLKRADRLHGRDRRTRTRQPPRQRGQGEAGHRRKKLKVPSCKFKVSDRSVPTFNFQLSNL